MKSSSQHQFRMVLLLALACPFTIWAAPDQLLLNNSGYPVGIGDWGKFFQIKNDFLVTVDMAKGTMGNCWLLLGVIYVVTLGFLRLALIGHKKS